MKNECYSVYTQKVMDDKIHGKNSAIVIHDRSPPARRATQCMLYTRQQDSAPHIQY